MRKQRSSKTARWFFQVPSGGWNVDIFRERAQGIVVFLHSAYGKHWLIKKKNHISNCNGVIVTSYLNLVLAIHMSYPSKKCHGNQWSTVYQICMFHIGWLFRRHVISIKLPFASPAVPNSEQPDPEFIPFCNAVSHNVYNGSDTHRAYNCTVASERSDRRMRLTIIVMEAAPIWAAGEPGERSNRLHRTNHKY